MFQVHNNPSYYRGTRKSGVMWGITMRINVQQSQKGEKKKPGMFSLSVGLLLVAGILAGGLVSAEIIARFAAVPATGPAPLNVTLVDMSQGNVTGWNYTVWNNTWSVSDNYTYPDTSPVYRFETPGTYNVTLIAYNASSVSENNTVTTTVNVTKPVIAANFTAVARNGTSPLNVSFIDQSVGTPNLTYLWDFGDNFTSTLQNPEHVYYNRTSPYSVNLTITDRYGQNSSLNKTNYIHVANSTYPDVRFTFTPNYGEFPLNVTFIDQSILDPESDTDSVMYYWDFGDGSSSNDGLSRQVHTYTTAGDRYPSLRIVYPDGRSGNSTTTSGQDYHITVTTPAPVANFTAVPPSGPTPLNVTFVDVSTSSLPIVAYFWNFGDNFTQVNVSSPQHQYTEPGQYNVTLTVTDSRGTNGSVTQIHAVDAQSFVYPIPHFTVTPLNGTAPLNVSVIDQSVLDPAVPSNAYTYQWVITDGSADPGDVRNFDHQFLMNGTYTIQLEITTPQGSPVTSEEVEITVGQPGIEANFTAASRTGNAPLLVSYIDQSTSPVNITSYEWDFGDDVGTSTERNPEYEYAEWGTYNVTLNVTNEAGERDSEIKTEFVTVYPSNYPVVKFGMFPVEGQAPLKVSFIDQSILDPAISEFAYMYAWYFEWDGQPYYTNERNIEHIYSVPGIYTPRLEIYDYNGNLLNFSQAGWQVYVNEPDTPIASFIPVPRSGKIPLEVSFIDQSAGIAPLVYNWTFGDGSISSERSPKHLYNTTGTYYVNLNVTDGLGQSNTTSDMIVATGPGSLPDFKADFTASPLNGTRPLTVEFADNSTGGYPNSWFWKFGDGTIGVGPQVNHTYVRSGQYDVSLTVRMESTRSSISKSRLITVA